jgi:hypothetical protein
LNISFKFTGGLMNIIEALILDECLNFDEASSGKDQIKAGLRGRVIGHQADSHSFSCSFD